MTYAAAFLRLLVFPLVFSSVRPAHAEDLTSKFDQYMDASVKVDHFSGSVLVSRDGQVLFAKGYGLANREHNIPNTPSTKFRLGSITKQFTAMAIMILVDEGKIKVDDPVSKCLDNAPKTWDGVTIHHLLTHTSGIHNYTADLDYVKKMTVPETVKSMIGRFKDKPLDFKPGEKFSYSNSGYFLLGAVIEHVSKMSYEEFLRRRIFEPLGMKDSGYDHPSKVLEHRASGYQPNGDGFMNASYLDMSQPYAAGSLYSTVLDLAKWDRALSDGKLISKEAYRKMYTTAKNDYAYGWGVMTISGRKRIGHGGGINGFITQIVRYPDDKLCVIALCNVVPNSPAKVANGLAAIALGDPYRLPAEHKVAAVDPKIFDAYAGRYQISSDRRADVIREGARLFVELSGQPRQELFPESETDFFLKTRDVQFRFLKGNESRASQLILYYPGGEEKGQRIDKDEAKPEPARAGKNKSS